MSYARVKLALDQLRGMHRSDKEVFKQAFDAMLEMNPNIRPDDEPAYTIQPSDAGKEIIITNSVGVGIAIPNGLPVNFHFIVSQAGAGVPTVTPDSGTINGAGLGVTPDGQWAGIYVGQYLAGEWMAKGAA